MTTKRNNGSVLVAIVSSGGWTPLVRQPDYRGTVLWKFPGGRIEEGETPEEAGIREVSEEIALNLRGFSLQRLAEESREVHGSAFIQYLLGVVVPDDMLARYIGDYVTAFDDENVRHQSTCFKLSKLESMQDFMPSHIDMLLKSQQMQLAAE